MRDGVIDPEKERLETLRRLERGPFTALLGLRIEHAEDGRARVRLPFDGKLLNERGPIHGGAIAALVDIAACAAVWSLPGTTRTTTVTLTVNFIAPGFCHDLIADAVVRNRGRHVATLAVEVRELPGLQLIADGLVTYKRN